MQVFVRGLQGCTAAYEVEDGSSTVEELMHRIEAVELVPAHSQGLVYGSMYLQAEQPLASYGVTAGSTLHLVLRLRGGKGGFGALLRGQGRDGKITTNFDACRDLQGRRLRFSSQEEKMRQWKAEQKERELEEVAKKFLKEEARKQRRALFEVDEHAVAHEQHKALQSVQSALKDALAASTAGAGPSSSPPGAAAAAAGGASSSSPAAGAGGKRRAEDADGAEPSAKAGPSKPAPKKARGMMAELEAISDVSDSEEEDE